MLDKKTLIPANQSIPPQKVIKPASPHDPTFNHQYNQSALYTIYIGFNREGDKEKERM